VRLTQSGTMRQRPGARPLPFTAVEEIAVSDVEFRWDATFHHFPLVSLEIVDRYESGQGRLDGRLGGVLPVLSARGPDLDAGEAMRYLSELPWVPHALLANRHLVWRQVSQRQVEVSTAVRAGVVAVRFEFDAAGDIVGARADARPRKIGRFNVPTPWSGVFAAQHQIGRVRIPTRAEVRWELPEGPFVYWRGEITGIELLY